MPSTTSRTVSIDFASSTVITPSLPTFDIASERIAPIVSSLFAEIVPTWAISLASRVGLLCFESSSVIAATAVSMPRLSSIGFMPATTSLLPSRKIDWARTVAVVVPSPALSEVLLATSFTIWAPMFSNLSSSSISLATVTPSLVTVGEPKLFSITTLRPRGPSVTRTALASALTPTSSLARASWSKRISLAAIAESSLLADAEDVVLADDEMLLALDLDLGAGVLVEEHAVTLLDLERLELAVLEHLALADGDDLALGGLLLGGVGDDDPPLGLLLLLDALDENAVLQRTDLHAERSSTAPPPALAGRAPLPKAGFDLALGRSKCQAGRNVARAPTGQGRAHPTGSRTDRPAAPPGLTFAQLSS